MSPVRENVLNSINLIPDNKLELLFPLLHHLAEEADKD